MLGCRLGNKGHEEAPKKNLDSGGLRRNTRAHRNVASIFLLIKLSPLGAPRDQGGERRARGNYPSESCSHQALNIRLNGREKKNHTGRLVKLFQ